MAYSIDKTVCVGCGACESTCPVSAIAPCDAVYKIDSDACVSCGACAGGCPVEAISE
jgi:formate hydrogenlyase subunit 6/NADH:ubiquinone oxidoreductase subunit I